MPEPSPYKPNLAMYFVFLSVLTGLIGAFVNPLMSYFIVEGLQSPPMYIGIYTASVTVSGIVVSQWLGRLADKGSNVKKLYTIATLGTLLGLVVFIFQSSFIAVLLAGVFFMSFGNASVPQMLTLGRQWADQSPISITEFNAKVRAGMSFSWVIGPAAGFGLVAWIGFYASFSIAIIFALLAIVFMWRVIPPVVVKPKDAKPTDIEVKIPQSFWFLVVTVMLGMTANLIYSSSLPLYLVRELAMPDYLPGVLMGLAACLEIPVMLFVGKKARGPMKAYLVMLGFILAMVFYIGIYFSDTLWQFVVLQIINALYYGIYAGLGLTMMQEQLPERIGFTSTLYSNAMKVGMMLGTTCTGLIAQFYSFRAANLGAFTAVLLACVCMYIFRMLKKRELKASL